MAKSNFMWSGAKLFATAQRCIRCGSVYAPNDPTLVCNSCGSPLDIEYNLDKIRERTRESLNDRTRSLWRFREFLPITKTESIVSLQEGMTPVNAAARYGETIGVKQLFLKLDYLNPTGSFKDRGNSVNVSRLRELNVTSVIEDSSGNAGSSLAAYCANAAIHCTLYVPEYTVQEKLVQAQIYGAEIVRIPGSRTDVARAAEKAWKTSGKYYASHNLSPFFFEGMKTVAYEIASDLSWNVPDHVVFPVGGGGLMAGTWKGFKELVALGWVSKLPKFHCVQSDACMPIVEAYDKKLEAITPFAEKETIAGGIRISNPARGSQVLQAVRASHGVALSVSDGTILRQQRLLARTEGIFAEPTSCAALAGLEKLREMGEVGSDETVVVPLTGFGLKDTKSAAIEVH